LKKIIILFFGISTITFSQKTTLSGTVKDSLQNPMPYANVIAKPKNVSKNIQFVKTQQFTSKAILKFNNRKKVHKKNKKNLHNPIFFFRFQKMG
jgi:hypothetical protein